MSESSSESDWAQEPTPSPEPEWPEGKITVTVTWLASTDPDLCGPACGTGAAGEERTKDQCLRMGV